MDEITSPIKAIRAKCLDCCCGSANQVKDCGVEKCPLFRFRFGKNPYYRKREMSEEQRRMAAERLKKIRDAKANE